MRFAAKYGHKSVVEMLCARFGADVQSSMGSSMPVDSQPMFSLVMKGSFVVSMDEHDNMEVFEGTYMDDEHGRVSVRCHVGAVYVVPPGARKPDGSVELSNGSGIYSVGDGGGRNQ